MEKVVRRVAFIFHSQYPPYSSMLVVIEDLGFANCYGFRPRIHKHCKMLSDAAGSRDQTLEKGTICLFIVVVCSQFFLERRKVLPRFDHSGSHDSITELERYRYTRAVISSCRFASRPFAYEDVAVFTSAKQEISPLVPMCQHSEKREIASISVRPMFGAGVSRKKIHSPTRCSV